MATKRLEMIIPKKEAGMNSHDLSKWYENFSEKVLLNLEEKGEVTISGFQSVGHMYEFEGELMNKMLHIQSCGFRGYYIDDGNKKITLTADYNKNSHISLDNKRLKIDLTKN